MKPGYRGSRQGLAALPSPSVKARASSFIAAGSGPGGDGPAVLAGRHRVDEGEAVLLRVGGEGCAVLARLHVEDDEDDVVAQPPDGLRGLPMLCTALLP